MTTATVQIRRKGVITIPSAFRRGNDLKEGDVLNFTELGEGVFLLNARNSQVARLGDAVAEILDAENVTVEEMFDVLEQERRAYYQEHYAEAEPVSG